MTRGPPRRIAGRQAIAIGVVALVVVSGIAIQTPSFPSSDPDTEDGPGSADETATATAAPIAEPPTETSARSPEPSWEEYRAIVVFRNDDVQPGWREDELRYVHGVFAEAGVPITDGVIPVVGNTSVTAAPSFCRYLTSLRERHPGQFEFAIHGDAHTRRTDFHGGSEFGGAPYETQLERLRRGKRIVTDCVGETPVTFIPPFDTYDENTTRALSAVNVTAVSGRSSFTESYFGASGVFTTGGVWHVPSERSFVENYTTNAFYDPTELESGFDAAYRNRSVFVQTLHYPYFRSSERLDVLRRFIAYVKSKEGVKFTTVGRLREGLESGTIERTDDGWKVLEPASARTGTTNATGETSDS